MNRTQGKYVDTLLEKIEQADAICVGAAAGMSVATGYDYFYRDDEIFKKYFSEFEKKYGFKGCFNGYYYRYRTSEERWAFIATLGHVSAKLPDGPAYENLFHLLQGKNYFVVTTNQDGLFYQRFPEEKISAIQGDWKYFQCVQPCHDKIYENEKMIKEMYANIHDCKIPTKLIPRCPVCGQELEPWVRGYTFLEGAKYKEEYEKWNQFLLENKDKKILFLELGVGRMTPMFIQQPFWNMTYSWSNAYYISINPKDALLPKELDNKGIAIKEDIGVILQEAVEQLHGKTEKNIK